MATNLALNVGDKVQFWLAGTPMTGNILFGVGTNAAGVKLESGAEIFIDLGTVTQVL